MFFSDIFFLCAPILECYICIDLLSPNADHIMDRVLVHSANVPSIVPSRRHGQCQESGKSRRSVKMMSCLKAPGMRMGSFTGLRGSNALDNLGKSGQDFHSRVAVSLSSVRGRGNRGVAKAMFERFTEKAIKVIMLAQEEARRLGHNFVGTEQILLGLIGEGTGIAAKVLKSMGINLKDARVEVEKIIGRGSGFVAVEIPFTPRAKRVLELSLEEARQLGRKVVLNLSGINYALYIDQTHAFEFSSEFFSVLVLWPFFVLTGS